MDEKPKKTPGTGRGTGRKLGSKNVLAPEAKQSMAQFFESLTADNYRWRTRVKRILDGDPRRTTEQEFHKWSLIALDRTLGTPAKHQPEREKRQSLYFVTTTGLYPWQMDNMKEQTDAMIAQADAEARLQLEAATKPAEVIDVTKGDTDVESLEVVTPPPADDPSAFR